MRKFHVAHNKDAVFFHLFGNGCKEYTDDFDTLMKLVNALPEKGWKETYARNKIMFEERYTIPMTYQELGNKYGITRCRVMQIMNQIFKKLKHPSRIKYLKRSN